MNYTIFRRKFNLLFQSTYPSLQKLGGNGRYTRGSNRLIDCLQAGNDYLLGGTLGQQLPRLVLYRSSAR